MIRLFARGIRQKACLCTRAGILIAAATIICAASISSRVVAAEPSTTVIERVELGFDGHYKLGYWTPLAVSVSGLPPANDLVLEVTVPDSDGVPSRVSCPLVVKRESGSSASARETNNATVQLLVKVGRNSGEMTVAVKSSDEIVARRTYDLAGSELPPALPSDAWFVLSLGKTRHLAETLGRDRSFVAAGGLVAQVTNAEQLPERWCGYEGVDAILISGGAEHLEELLASPRMGALEQWLARGGTALMTVGTGADKILVPDGPAARWAPGRFQRIVPLTSAAALERASGVEAPLESLTEGEPLRLNIARLVDLRGRVLAHTQGKSTDLPLILERLDGFGRVLFVAVDLDESLFGRWTGTGPLLTGILLPHRVSGQTETSDALGEVTHAGYDDLSGQLRSALDQFQNQGVRMLPFGLLFALLFGYILLLGPGDFFFLKRLLRRMEATWVTLPLLIALACGGAYALAAGMKGSAVRANQVDVVDFDNTSGARRATTWLTLFSPRGQAYSLSLAPTAHEAKRRRAANDGGAHPFVPKDVLLSWFGLPGAALGGMQSRSNSLVGGQPYEFSRSLDKVEDVPIPIWSTKSFVARWTPAGESPVTADLGVAASRLSGMLRGSITNRGDVALDACVLLTDRWAYSLGSIAPGQTVTLGDDAEPRLLEAHLLRRADVSERYDRYDLDVPRILEMMTFYEVSGGRDYTRLKHRYEGNIDLSAQLREGRAVLYGVSGRPAVTVLSGAAPLVGDDRGHTAVYRMVLKVAQTPAAAD